MRGSEPDDPRRSVRPACPKQVARPALRASPLRRRSRCDVPSWPPSCWPLPCSCPRWRAPGPRWPPTCPARCPRRSAGCSPACRRRAGRTPTVNALAAAVMADQEADADPRGPGRRRGERRHRRRLHLRRPVHRPRPHTRQPAQRPDHAGRPRVLPNSRTPAFDLDSLYGGGPAGSPQLYAADRMHLLLGAPLTGRPPTRGPSTCRATRRAGRPCPATRAMTRTASSRALHTIMLRFHNDGSTA